MSDLGGRTRILIYGVTGSGKTTLAFRLGELTGLPAHEVDQLTWEPNWKPVPLEEQRRRIESICREERWILDTAYNSWKDIPMERAQLVVALDYPRGTSLRRLLARCLQRILDRKPICNGNRETFANTFLSRESILLWHFRSYRRKRDRIAEMEARQEGPAVLRIKSPRELESWIERLKADAWDSPEIRGPRS